MKRCALLSLVVLGLLLVATNAQAQLFDRLAPCGSPCGACDEVAVDPCEAVIVDDCGACDPCCGGGGILPLGILDRIRGLIDPCGACDPCGDPCGVCDEVIDVDPCEAVVDDCGACDPCAGGGILPLGIRDRIRDLCCDPCGAPCGTCEEVAVDPCEAVIVDDCGVCDPCAGGGILDRLRALKDRCGACDPCGDPCGVCDEVLVDPCEAVIVDECGACDPCAGGGILPLGILDRLRGLVDCGACDPCGDPCGVCDEVLVDPCEAVVVDDCGACDPCAGGILPLRGGFFNRLKDACDPCGDPCGTCDEVAVDPCDPCGC